MLSRFIPPTNRLIIAATFVATLAISGCGGGGGGSSSPPPAAPPPAATNSDFDRGVFSSSSLYKDFCAVPRVGNFPDTPGSTEDENDWLRAWSNELYLWYDEITDIDPRQLTTPAYFDEMKTFALTPSGNPRDNFHFTFDTEEWLQLSQSGISAGYGADFVLESASPPRRVVIAFVDAGTPAANAGLTRGTVVLRVDGVDVVNGSTQADVDTLNAGLFPEAGQTHTFQVEAFDGTNRRVVSMDAASLTQDPVPMAKVIDTPTGPVGYMLFNTHIATAEERLVAEMTAFETAGITDLVLDLRYNGGGFLAIANELAYMIAGPAAASGRVFDETQFNDKHTTANPVTGEALAPDIFLDVAQGFSVPTGTLLPSVNLPRVFILSGTGTCSASEAIINGLQGIDVEVILIGDTTCGKPYGFYPFDNCGTTYFSIQFRGVNAKGFGDYADGFFPLEFGGDVEVEVNGCPIPDDYTKALGDETEARLASALQFRTAGECNPLPASLSAALSRSATQKVPGLQPALSLTEPNRMPGTVRLR